ncbi:MULTISPECIES: hypothetical protein [Streptomyces]|uniref:Uncharacterized protein n=1 Tax=Streptomyces tsukubensis (strain DSM 42081 / NBRC 108919 / NRRL 18488 / 9993) TaxID=1114943 RepID=I2N062_STRT9|nr:MULTISPECIES: hypothetical protein [Streptomyces]AZK94615.1 hypothetical protein B7R87_12625 [Streptomyces tsukubensis]EIF90409.1 hypothetical protein [Streptomyces tsukubensis NRRL18488]MYS65569.1 hypothetical protein [Streptomyces sp. SID5473]QKM69302.1 hypothetical protein STSU_021150 [Streptomyces tsukubensis NRRL18488]TAI42766.1 hypothetical protein EWI31_20385 [Streptomyces tsukubensis]
MSGTLRRRATIGAISLILAVPLGLTAPAAGAAEKPAKNTTAAMTVAQLQQNYGDLNGLRLQNVDGTSGVWVVIDGKRHGVPDMWTYNNLFANWKIVTLYDLYNIPYGGHLTHDAHLITSPSSDTVWLLTNNEKRGITGRAFAKYEFDGNKIQSVRDIVLNAIPRGPNIDL